MTAATFGCASASRGVDRDDPRVRVRAAQHRAVDHPRQPDVVEVGALAADEARVLLALQPAEADRPLGLALGRFSTMAMLRPPVVAALVLGGPADRGDDVLVARAAADARRRSRCGSPARSGPGSRPAARGRSSASPACRSRTAARGSSWKPCWTGSSAPSTSSDSTVRISWPSHIAARIVHDLTGLPSISTTQAPQLEVSQPQCVPVRPSVSRMKWTSSVARLDVARDLLAVDGDRHLHVQASCCSARAVARRRARLVSTPARWRL